MTLEICANKIVEVRVTKVNKRDRIIILKFVSIAMRALKPTVKFSIKIMYSHETTNAETMETNIDKPKRNKKPNSDVEVNNIFGIPINSIKKETKTGASETATKGGSMRKAAMKQVLPTTERIFTEEIAQTHKEETPKM